MSFLTQPVTLQSLFGQNRTFGKIKVEVIINENTNDTLVITKQPVQQDSPITDHAYKEPTVLSMKIRFSDNIFTKLKDIYAELLKVQFPPVPIDVITPKRIYKDMLIATLSLTTDKYTENVLAIDVTFQQIILVKIGKAKVDPKARQRTPQRTQGTQDTGKKQSFIYKLSGRQ